MWTANTARWFAGASSESDFSGKVLAVIQPFLEACESVLDIGAGTGVFAVPIAESGHRVTAVEPSAPMAAIMDKEARRRGVRNRIRIVRKTWQSARVGVHDTVLCINAPASLTDDAGFIRRADRLSRRFVCVVQGVAAPRHRFFYDELFPLLFGKTCPDRGDYHETLHAARDGGINPDVRIIEYNFDQWFTDMDEAIRFWEEHLGLKRGERRDVLEPFLQKKLKRQAGGALLLPIHRRSAMLMWKK